MRILLLGAILLLLAVMPGALQGPRGAEAAFSGDFNCDGSVNTQDVIAVLAVSGGVQPISSCSNAVSVDCDGDTDVTDALVLLHYLAATSVSLPAGCSDINALIPGTSPQDAADQLLARITGGGTFIDVVQGVEESLARGGVSTGDANGTIYTQAVEPAALSVAIPLEVMNLAVAARASSYQMDAVELGQMLADFGWPFLDGSTPGEQIVAMLQELVIGAQGLPDDPNSFTPLFLQNMGLAQDPAVDFATGNAAPEDVHFSLLALRLLSAVFERQTVYPDQPQSQLAVPAANEPCTDAKAVLNGIYGPMGGQVHGLLLGEAGPKFVEKALEKAGATKAAGKAGDALGVLGTISKIWKLIDFYASSHVDVQIIDGSNRLHKPNENEADEERTFNATAGISPEDWAAYEAANKNVGSETNKAVRDCLATFGLPVFSDLGDLMKDAANWKIDWTISNNENHKNTRGETPITWDFGKQESGRLQGGWWRSNTIKTSDYSYEAAFLVDVGDELTADHTGQPTIKIADVYVCANVISAQPPDISVLVNAMKNVLGLIDSITELAAGWVREVAPPQSCRTLTVLWHEPCPLGAQSADAFNARFEPAVSIQAITSLDQLPCEWTGTAHASIHHYSFGAPPYAYEEVGEIDGTFTFGNPQLSGSGNSMTYDIISGSATWQASGHWSSCSFSKSGTEEVHGYLSVSDDGSGQLTYSGFGATTGQDRVVDCGVNSPLIETNAFFSTCPPDTRPLTSLDLSGSCSSDHTTWNEEYDWHLSGISCSAAAAVTPEGVCGGAASSLSGSPIFLRS